MSFYWKRQPVEVKDTITNLFTPIKTFDELYKEVKDRISSYDVKLDYEVLSFRGLSEAKQASILDFMNENYVVSKDNVFHLSYDIHILSFFCQPHSILVEFKAKNTDRVIGYFMGNPHKLYIHGKVIDCFEANFLCLLPKLRRLGVAPLMMDILMREALERLRITVYNYTIQQRINSPYYAEKSIFHRYLNTNLLVDVGLVSPTMYTKKFHETFEVSDDFRNHHYVQKTDKYDEALYQQYLCFYKRHYQLYSLLDNSVFKEMMENPSFLNYVIKKTSDNSVVGLFCFYRTTIIHTEKNIKIASVTFYVGFWDNFNDAFELVMESIYQEHSADQVCLADIQIKSSRCMKSNALLRYYMYNLRMLSVANNKNALVTI
jgi:hypothetical protein